MAEILQRLPKYCDAWVIGLGNAYYNSNPWNLRWLLRFC
jgi:hypothetical protein